MVRATSSGASEDTASTAASAATSKSKLDIKSTAEIFRYMKCYLPKNRKLENAQEYMKLIEAAAREFDFPTAFLACLIFRESAGFDPNAKSSAGAQGLGQFLGVTAKFVNGIIRSGNLDRDDELRFKKIYIDRKSDKEEKVWAESVLRNFELARRWKAYFARLNAQNLTTLKQAPEGFTIADARSPQKAIGAAALYLRFIFEFMDDELNSRGKLNLGSRNEPKPDTLLVVGGAYNMGHGAAVKRLSKTAASLPAWHQRLRRSNRETQNHMDSIQNCMQAGNWKPMSGTEKRRCE
jgi:hypothetical protein